jgi:hypothetical protein
MPTFEFPQKETKDDVPAGVTIYPDRRFTDLPPHLQERVKRGDIPLKQAWEEQHGDIHDGAYSIRSVAKQETKKHMSFPVVKNSPLGVTTQAMPKESVHDTVHTLYKNINEQNENAKQTLSSLTPEETKHFYNALTLLATNTNAINTFRSGGAGSPNTHNIYTTLDTVLRHDRNFLNTSYTISALWKRAKELEGKEKKETLAKKYAEDLGTILPKDFDYTNEMQKQVQNVFTTKTPKQWHDAVAHSIGADVLNSAVTTFCTQAFAKDPHDPRNTNILTESILALINPEQQKEIIGTVALEDGTSFDLWRLYTKKDLEEESAKLKHCVSDGNTYFYKIRGENPSHAIISLRQDGVPKWTLEIDLKTHTLLQFKGGGDVAVNSLPERNELPLRTFSALMKAGILIEQVKENFTYNIVKSDDAFKKVESKAFTPEYIMTHQEEQIVKGEIALESKTTLETFTHLATIPNLTIDATKVPKEVKKKIETIKGTLIDTSERVEYENLTHIGGSVGFNNLTSAEGLSSLVHIDGDALFDKLTSAEGLSSLVHIGGDAWFSNLTFAERAKIPALIV